MTWNLLDQNTVAFKTAGKSGYELIIDSSSVMGTFHMTSKVLYRWDFFITEILQNGYKASLLTLEHSLLETNNPGMNDIFMATKTMMGMFYEVHLVLDKYGRVTDILNLPDIYERYKRVKVQPISFSGGLSLRADQVYNIPEEHIQEKETVIKMVQTMEFFDIYFFGLYGSDGVELIKKERMNTMRNLSYTLRLKIQHKINPAGEKGRLLLNGANDAQGQDAVNKAFGQMPFVQGQELSFSAKCSGTINLNADGWIEQSTITIKEEVCTTLNGVIQYALRKL